MDFSVIHETILRDIIDIINNVKDTDEVKMLTNKGKSFKSIAAASSNLTIVTPLIASSSLSMDTVSMVSKAVERKNVTMLQMLFSAISITDADNAIDYIKKFHTNLKIDDNLDVDEFMDIMDALISNNESVCVSDMAFYEAVKKDLLNINHTLPDCVSESSLQGFKSYKNMYLNTLEVMNEDINTPQELKDIQNQLDKTAKNVSKTIKDTKDNISKMAKAASVLRGGGSSSLQDKKNAADIMKLRTELIHKQLLDTDVKKCNELIPTMMVINFVSTANSRNTPMQAVIGVKAKIYPVDSADIINRIKIKNEDKQGFLKLIKATTREISFMRDFIFAIDRAKLDALSQSKRGSSSKIWKVLERRALRSKIKRRLRSTNDASAISTLLISQEEVEYLKKDANIDVSRPNVIRPIMEAYNLMGVCIADESLEATYFIYDTGNDIYEQVPFKQLEREKSDSDYKKIINLMSKVR